MRYDYICYFISYTAVISIDQMNWTWCLLNIPRVDSIGGVHDRTQLRSRHYNELCNIMSIRRLPSLDVLFSRVNAWFAFIHFLWHPLKTRIESHHEMNDMLWHDIDKYLIKMCYMVMFVLSTKLWNLGNIRKNIISFKVNGDLSNPFRELSNGMKFEVCCFDLCVKCVVFSY